MTEFMFRNLSVKLLPEDAAAGAECICCSYEHVCDECSDCTGGPTVPPDCAPCTNGQTRGGGECGTSEEGCGATGGECGGASVGECFPCTEFNDTIPCLNVFSHDIPDCNGDTCQQDTTCIDTIPILLPPPLRSPATIRSELVILRGELRQVLGRTVEDDRAVAPRSAANLDEITQVRAALLDALAELDERQAELEPGAGG